MSEQMHQLTTPIEIRRKGHDMEEDTTLIGTQISNYHLTAEIGSGYLGTVYRARHVVTDSVVALKLLHMRLPVPTYEHFVQNAQFLTNLQHPHILSVIDVGLHDGRPYVVSEALSGGSLR